ncbi:unnamed protein product [Rotaria magnacalcarata]
MGQYLESYCFQLVQLKGGRIVFVYITNFKDLYVGATLMKTDFTRLLHVDPSWCRQHIAIDGYKKLNEVLNEKQLDIEFSSILATNIPSLSLTVNHQIGRSFKKSGLLDTFVVPTNSNTSYTQMQKLTREETEHFSMADQAH